MAAEMDPVAPAVGKEIGRADGQDRAPAFPMVGRRNFGGAPIPTDFVTGGVAIIESIDLQGIAIDAAGKIIVVVRGVGFAPSGEGLPAERNRNLLEPTRAFAGEPFLDN